MLRISRGQGDVEISAPTDYLRKMLVWCRGAYTFRDLHALSVKTWGTSDFIDFVRDLVLAGVLRAKNASGDSAVTIQASTLRDFAASTSDAIGGNTASGTSPSFALGLLLDAAKAALQARADTAVRLIVYETLERVPSGIYEVRMGSSDLELACLGCDPCEAARAFGKPEILLSSFGILIVSAGASDTTITKDLAPSPGLPGLDFQDISDFDPRWLRLVCNLEPSDDILLLRRVGCAGCTEAGRTVKSSLEFKWSDALERAPFHLAHAHITWCGGSTSEGWGRSLSPALTYDKAIAEAVERHAFSAPMGCRWEQADALDRFIPPASIVRYDRSQYRRKHFPFRPFSIKERRPWVQAQDANGGSTSWVLADCIFHANAFPAGYRNQLYTHATSSGCASATSIEQASLHAAMELVERDAFMRHWFSQSGGYNIPPKTLPAHFRSRVDLLVRSGCIVQVQCLHLGVFPTWMVLAQHGGLHFTCIGTGTGLDAAVSMKTITAKSIFFMSLPF
ncbi:MAG TPA: YcaO-like family protein [Noviherbaspirillum sp.]|nr:YcaO-like family protein [Noviherbaspirillum sp.]